MFKIDDVEGSVKQMPPLSVVLLSDFALKWQINIFFKSDSKPIFKILLLLKKHFEKPKITILMIWKQHLKIRLKATWSYMFEIM